MSPWAQDYNPLRNAALSTVAAATPVTVLFYLLAIRKASAHKAAVAAAVTAGIVAIAVFRMPPLMTLAAMANGVVFADIRMAWTLAAAVFVFQITVETGNFEVIKQSLGAVTNDRRLQALLIAFAFGALLEGAGGGGAPVAITASIMVGLGFPAFETVLLCLIANSGPVAFGGMGNPVRVLVAVTALPEVDLCRTLGRIIPWTTLIIPFWLVGVQSNVRSVMGVIPALLTAGVSFSALQFLTAGLGLNSLVDIISGMGSLAILMVFLRWWKPRESWRYPNEIPGAALCTRPPAGKILRAWTPWLLVAAFVGIWGLGPVATLVDSVTMRYPVPGLHHMSIRTPPVVTKAYSEPAVFDIAWLSAVGTATFLAGLVAGPIQGLSLNQTLRIFVQTVYRMRLSLIALMAMLALGYTTRYSGMDATLGLAMAHTGWLFPIFGTLIGWLGVVFTGTDAGSNALFGSLQVITAHRLGLKPVLMATANSAGGVMGKMMAAQSVVVGCSAAGIEGQEGGVFRAALKHSLLLALLVSGIVMLYAYVTPGA